MSESSKNHQLQYQHQTKENHTMKETILAGLFGLIGGAALALVYIYKTGGF